MQLAEFFRQMCISFLLKENSIYINKNKDVLKNLTQIRKLKCSTLTCNSLILTSKFFHYFTQGK